MKHYVIIPALFLCLTLNAQLRESVTWTKLNSHAANLPVIGKLKTISSDGSGKSWWSIGCETLDRDYSDFSKYKPYLKTWE